MKIYGNNKQVRCINWYNIVSNKPSDTFFYEPGDNKTVFLDSIANIKQKIKAVQKPVVKNTTLYFDKHSCFPRFKLQNTDFKRCIKLEKADQVIVNDEDISRILGSNDTTVTLIEDSKYIYYLNSSYDGYYAKKATEIYHVKSLVEVLVKINAIDSNYKVIVNGLTYVSTTPATSNLIINVIESLYTSIATDTELDTVVSNISESLDEESIDSVIEMLNSKDGSVVGLGLKLLINYNVLEYPLTISTILYMSGYKCVSNPVWKSTAVQQLVNTLRLDVYQIKNCSRTSILNIIKYCNNSNNIVYTDKDKDLAKKLVLKQLIPELNKIEAELQQTVESFNIKINLNAE